MAARKTLQTAFALEKANAYLANSPDEYAGERRGVASFIETLLHSADAYAGFVYLDSAQVDRDRLINGDRRFEAKDETRRCYLKQRGL